jgi:hypothetical protein
MVVNTKNTDWGANAALKNSHSDIIPINSSSELEPQETNELHIEAKIPNLKLVPPSIYLLDLSIGSPEFEILRSRFTHPKAAVVLQYLEFLNRTFEMPDNGIYRNIFPRKDKPGNKTITEHIGISSRRIVYAILNEVRVSYTFTRGVLLIPAEIDFKGKLYASFYLPSHGHRTVYWYRNEKLINQLYEEILEELQNREQSQKFKHVAPRKSLCEHPSGSTSEQPSEPSYTYEEVIKKEKKHKINNSLKLVTTTLDKKHTKTTGKTKPQTQSNLIKSKTDSVSKKEINPILHLGIETYPIYKKYCETVDNKILMRVVPTPTETKSLNRFVKTFIDLGVDRQDLPQFFAELANNHDSASQYVKDRDVWQVKGCVYFMSLNFLANHGALLASWYNAVIVEKSKVKPPKKSEVAEIEELPNPNKSGYTYEIDSMAVDTSKQSSAEYDYVMYSTTGDDSDVFFADICMEVILKDAIDRDASLARIAYLKGLTPEEFTNFSFPR